LNYFLSLLLSNKCQILTKNQNQIETKST